MFSNRFLILALLLPVLLAFQSCTRAEGEVASISAPDLDGKEVLIVYGGWPGHEPKQCMEYFKPWLESEGASVYVSDSLGIYSDSAFMADLDLTIQIWTMDKISGSQAQGLTDAVRKGMGFAGWHGGAGDSFREEVRYQFMVGGQWVAHPGGILDYEVNVIDSEDPITAGIEDFSMTSEQYYMHVDPNVKVLATTTFSGEHDSWIDGAVIPVIWKKFYGDGRIFYSSLGHQLDHLKTPKAMETVKRGIRWASESKYQPKESWLQPIYDME
ncbi:MAG TPA: ThuA domain-containing protein [Saprospiraceae bacterium]|nr:ThuA domain-containing protein [Saprospiraceae bacterium]